MSEEIKGIIHPSRTKIVVTIGPASSSEEILKQMIAEGIGAFRLNFSHGDHQGHTDVIMKIRKVSRELYTNAAILADLQGPKLRIGIMHNNGVNLKFGDTIYFTTSACIGTKEMVFLNYESFPADVKPGERILVDDGKLQFEVTETNGKDLVKMKVLTDGVLASNKGVNLPYTKVTLPSLTEKDREDVEFALKMDVDWIALSFVRSAKDINELHDLIRQHGKNTYVIAKIEKPEALEELDEIIEVSDGVMVARGDLGVEVPFDRVPLIQKDIVDRCIKKSRPVIIATQMMESMITNYAPTRAEANDVANSLLDGADALMLSGETSVGKYPVQTIRAMQQIISWTEDHAYPFYLDISPVRRHETYLPDNICFNASQLAKNAGAKAIICFTHSGYSAARISSYRPEAPIFTFTTSADQISRMSFIWGIRAFLFEEHSNIETAITNSVEILMKHNLVNKGDTVIHVGSIPYDLKGPANMIRLSGV
jgi:pyruvate kinase